jgi:hypothetical protein
MHFTLRNSLYVWGCLGLFVLASHVVPQAGYSGHDLHDRFYRVYSVALEISPFFLLACAWRSSFVGHTTVPELYISGHSLMNELSIALFIISWYQINFDPSLPFPLLSFPS